MGLKDEVEFVKESLSTDEKILENAFKVEKTYNKHKKKIWLFVGLVVLAIVAWNYKSYQEKKSTVMANETLRALEKSPDDKALADKLKSLNPKLYELYSYSAAIKSTDKKELERLSKGSDKLIADISRYHLGLLNQDQKDSKYYHDLSIMQEAYEALNKKNYKMAKSKLMQIDDSSPLAGVAKKMSHYLAGK